ncbi:hypothetical protein [Pseudothermotoga sp.]|nr:hypothetical protein [Pseudothermotoga sp.]MCX7812989.1 hypothetical protein [Pseudothermotoga sp.]MDW8139772.1 hypothetical protein [Pseudothermotoga sp.]
MRKILLISLLSLGLMSVFSSNFSFSGGVSIGKIQGWNLSMGVLDERFSVEAGLSFDVGGVFSASQFDFYNLEFLTKFSLYSSDSFNLGPMLGIMFGNFGTEEATPTWNSKIFAGIYTNYVLGNIELSAGLTYPLSNQLDFVEMVHVSAKFFPTPPRGKTFSDRFFFGLDLLGGRLRCSFGFIESF